MTNKLKAIERSMDSIMSMSVRITTQDLGNGSFFWWLNRKQGLLMVHPDVHHDLHTGVREEEAAPDLVVVVPEVTLRIKGPGRRIITAMGVWPFCCTSEVQAL